MDFELQPVGQQSQDLLDREGGYNLLAEALLLDASVRQNLGLNEIQGNEQLKRRLTREVSIGLVLASRELGLDVPALTTAERAKDEDPHIASADWSEGRGGEITFVRKYLRRFVTRMYTDKPYYFVVPHELFHIRQLMLDYAKVGSDLKVKDWTKTKTEKDANSFAQSVLFRYSSDIQLALQGLPSPRRT